MSDSKKLDSIEDLLRRLLEALTGPSQSSAAAPPWEKISVTLETIAKGQISYIETLKDAAKAIREVRSENITLRSELTALRTRFDAVLQELQKM